MKKHCLLCITVLFLGMPALAQQGKIHSQVEVERAYAGELTGISKPAQATTVPDSLRFFSTLIDYTILEQPYRDVYSFNPLPFAQVQPSAGEKPSRFNARLGIGYPLLADGTARVATPLSKRSFLGLSGMHHSFWGDVPIVDPTPNKAPMVLPHVQASQMRNKGGIDYTWQKRDFCVTANLTYRQNYHTYYGFNPYFITESPTLLSLRHNGKGFLQDSLSHRYQQIETRVGFALADTLQTGWLYAGNLAFGRAVDRGALYKNIFRIRENRLAATGSVAYRFGFGGKVAVTVTYEGLSTIGKDKGLDRGLIQIRPHFSWTWKNLDFMAGVNTAIDLQGAVHHLPIAQARFALLPEILWITAEMRGRKELIAYQDLMQENPWISPYMSLHTRTTPIDVEIGANGLFWESLAARIFAGYRYTMGQYYYVCDRHQLHAGWNQPLPNVFELAVSEEERFTVGGEARFTSHSFEGGLRLQYNRYTVNSIDPAWGRPAFEASCSAKYNWRKRITASVGAYYRSSTHGLFYYAKEDAPMHYGSGKCPAFLDLNAELSYRINKLFSVFVEGRNLLNAKEQYYLLYRQPGIRMEAGIYLHF